MSANTPPDLSPARFGDVEIGGWFRESPNGAWHLKTHSDRGLYEAGGVIAEPAFGPDEIVLVPARASLEACVG